MEVSELMEKADAARSLLFDEKSRKVFDSILQRASGASNDISLMPEIYEGNQYFPQDVVKLTKEESYVDVGAYDGDTVKQFFQVCSHAFNHVYAIELDRYNYEKLRDDMQSSPHANRISTYNMAAWHKNENITFKPGLTQSTVGNGNSSAAAVKLDDLLKNKTITYIKMDIEGAEIKALQGARDLILSQQPKLAICVYHKISHLWEIPLLIHELLPEHDLYLRHHTRLEYETVCYAIPKA
jgi:FkbM family methyltransferase